MDWDIEIAMERHSADALAWDRESARLTYKDADGVVSFLDISEADLLALVRPEDLTKFGLIPEFIGRLPLIASVSKLDRPALVQILTEPRNALVKQYQKLFDLDGVELVFTDDAVDAIADKAMERGTGARGLRAIIEEVLLQVMYDVPSRGDVAKVVVSGAVVTGEEAPELVLRESETKKRKSA